MTKYIDEKLLHIIKNNVEAADFATSTLFLFVLISRFEPATETFRERLRFPRYR
jgi:hypothetical protein